MTIALNATAKVMPSAPQVNKFVDSYIVDYINRNPLNNEAPSFVAGCEINALLSVSPYYTDTSEESSDAKIFIVTVLGVRFALGLIIGMYILVAVMAKKRNRSPALWLLLSFITNPVLVYILLLVVGTKKAH